MLRRSQSRSGFLIAVLLLNSCTVKASAGDSRPEDAGNGHSIRADAASGSIWIANRDLRFRVSYRGGCTIDSQSIGGTLVPGARGNGFTGCRTDSTWYTSKNTAGAPTVTAFADSVSINNIVFAAARDTVTESWGFSFSGDQILWTIDRALPKTVVMADNAFPAIQIDTIGRYDGALLGNGGVAWFRLFNDTVIAYGVHTNEATLWSTRDRNCLQLTARPENGAINISRTGESLSFTFPAPPSELSYRFDAGTHRRRLLRGRTDVWQPAAYPAGTYHQVLRLSAPGFQEKIARGEFKGIDGEAVTSMLNTIARLGVIDSKHYGGNSWHTPYGPICLHEQYIAQFGAAIDDANYLTGYKACLDYYRDHAILPDGRVKSRWAYTDEDAAPGSADSLGFYEAQWGILMDSQPDFVINVAELFDQCGDVTWLGSHKQSTENVLEYMLRRDTDHNHLVEMATASHTQAKGSDWIDIIWASWENALVNAELYRALTLWSDIEGLLGDNAKADHYRQFAAALKVSFNRTTRKGGFWDEKHKWYVHWREKDGSVFGNNLVIPVNFMAISYGLCDDAGRRNSILSAIETQMKNEHLFIWPLCMFPYEPGVGHRNNYPYPSYENGDIFLSWAEMGIRAYAEDFPEIALRYCTNVIERYKTDGLAYQRYLRRTQQGAGDDILAGNVSAVIGLYTDIFGIQPRYNRIVLKPRLVKDLYGTRVRYNFQGNVYSIALDRDAYFVTHGNITVASAHDFSVRITGSDVWWFTGTSSIPGLSLVRSDSSALSLTIKEWGDTRSWSERSASEQHPTHHRILGLHPDSAYRVTCDGRSMGIHRTSSGGALEFDYRHVDATEHTFELSALAMKE